MKLEARGAGDRYGTVCGSKRVNASTCGKQARTNLLTTFPLKRVINPLATASGSVPFAVRFADDLSALKTVATVDVGSEAAGVDFYKTEKPK